MGETKMRILITLSVLFSFTAQASDVVVETQVTNNGKAKSSESSFPSKEVYQDEHVEEVFTRDDFQQELVDKLYHETHRLQFRMGLPELYEQQGMGEIYISSEEWQYTEDRVINGFEDALKHSTIKAMWHSRPGEAIKRWGRLRLFAEQEKESDFDSPNRTRYGFMFGSPESHLPDFGFELSDQPEFRVEFYQRGNATEMKVDSSGNVTEEQILIRHRLSYKAGLLKTANGRARYEIGNIQGWFGLTFEHDLEDQTTRFFLDDLKVGDNMYLSSGISYHGQDDIFGFYENRMRVPAGSVVISLNLYGTFGDITDIPKAFNPANWSNPFRKEQSGLKVLARQQQYNRILLATAR